LKKIPGKKRGQAAFFGFGKKMPGKKRGQAAFFGFGKKMPVPFLVYSRTK